MPIYSSSRDVARQDIRDLNAPPFDEPAGNCRWSAEIDSHESTLLDEIWRENTPLLRTTKVGGVNIVRASVFLDGDLLYRKFD